MKRLVGWVAVMVMMTSVTLAAWGRFGEHADEAVPCGGKTPFDWWIKRHEGLLQQAKKGGIDVMFWGDSLTDFWSKEGKNVWEKEYVPLQAANFGIGGDQTQYVIYRMTHGELDGVQPKVVVLEIGTNNIAVSHHTPEEATIGVKAVVKLLREKLPETKVLLLGVFPQGQKPSNPSRAQHAAINKEISKLDDGKMIRYLDFGAKLLNEKGDIIDAMRSDGVHLSEKGYQVWADEMRPLLMEMLGKPAGS